MKHLPHGWIHFYKIKNKKEDRRSPNWCLDPPYLKAPLNSKASQCYLSLGGAREFEFTWQWCHGIPSLARPLLPPLPTNVIVTQ